MGTLLLLYDLLRWEEKDLLDKARGLFDVKPVHVKSSLLRLARGLQADVALQRASSLSRALSSASVVESWSVRVVNTTSSLYATGDKIWTHSLLARHGVPMPETYVVYSLEAALEAASRLGYPVVVKPVRGSWGRLVSRADDEEDLRTIIEHREAMGVDYRVYYVQEYIRKPGRDLRVFCIGDSVPAGIVRESSHWITNTARGAKSSPLKPDEELVDLTLRSCEGVGVEVGGVDIVEDPERGYLVLEVNGVPEYKNTVRVTGVDMSSLILEYLRSESRR
ncbi:MAG: lysine biosynthesis protein LysX [Desulfurococcales archaeon]|nr:lysine biosynthesis protein LysX [Desulfurococcales archaeon]